MAFEKPLKVFLSYAHRDAEDDPKLFQEFIDQLKSLVQDGLITRWDDRQITAGLSWDREIKEKLRSCDLFLALTSSAFNASDYIEGIEMRTAMERHEAGLCRIVPVMWRDWRPPKTFDALQFPNRNSPVADAEKKDAALRALAGHIELIVKEMTEGRWRPRQTALSPIPPSLAYICDWDVPIQKLRALRQAAGPERRPCVLVLVSTMNDCADEFLRRTHRAELPVELDFEAPVHDMRPLDWPQSPDLASGSLHRSLEAQAEWKIERKLREGLTPVKTVTVGWGPAKEAVLARMLLEWSEDAWVLPPNRCLLLIVSIMVSNWSLGARRKAKIEKRIESLAERRPKIPIKVITLPKIERDHALTWPDKPAVVAFRGNDAQPMTDSIRRLYRWRRRLAMKRLAPKLLTILQRSRQGAIA
jgi:hypothetical protein